MTLKNNWKKVKSWNVGTPDGSSETYTLYEDETSGCFRIQNDFGNITIDMERMSGHEFLKKLLGEVEKNIVSSDDDDWMFSLDLDSDSDCQSPHMD